MEPRTRVGGVLPALCGTVVLYWFVHNHIRIAVDQLYTYTNHLILLAYYLIIILAQHRQPTAARFQLKRRGGGGCARLGNHPSRVGDRSTLVTDQAVTTRAITDRHQSLPPVGDDRIITDRHPSDCRRLALVDTAGYSLLKDLDTPGRRRSSRSYSQQYESPPTTTRRCRRPAPIESPPIAISRFAIGRLPPGPICSATRPENAPNTAAGPVSDAVFK